MKRSRRAEKSAQSKHLLLTDADKKLYERLRKELTAGVEKLGDCVPELDDVLIDRAARSVIYAYKSEEWLDTAKGASEYASASDALAKHRTALRHAFDALAANRKQHLATESVDEISGKLEKIIDRVTGLGRGH